jgi:hypothetical protein
MVRLAEQLFFSGASAPRRGGQRLLDLREVTLVGEPGLRRRPGPLPQPPVRQGPARGGGQRPRITRGKLEPPLPVRQPLGDPAVIGADDRSTAAHGLDADHAEGLWPVGWHQDHGGPVVVAVDLLRGDEALEGDAPRGHAAGLGLEFLARGAVPDDGQVGSGEPPERIDRVGDALAPQELADEEQARRGGPG